MWIHVKKNRIYQIKDHGDKVPPREPSKEDKNKNKKRKKRKEKTEMFKCQNFIFLIYVKLNMLNTQNFNF